MSNEPEKDPTTESPEAFKPAYTPADASPKTVEELREEHVAKRTARAEAENASHREIVDQLNAENPSRSLIEKLTGRNKPIEYASPVTEVDIAMSDADVEKDERAAAAEDAKFDIIAEAYSRMRSGVEIEDDKRLAELEQRKEKFARQMHHIDDMKSQIRDLEEKLKTTPSYIEEGKKAQKELDQLRAALPGSQAYLTELSRDLDPFSTQPEETKIYIEKLNAARARRAAKMESSTTA